MFSFVHSWVARLHSPVEECSRLIIGSTGSGKSEGELVDLVRLADRRTHAIVLLDAHGPLASRAAGHWAVRGHEERLLYEPLRATDRVLCWDMLPQSVRSDPLQRSLDDAETRDEVAQCFMAHRNLGTLNDRAWTKDWLEAAIALCLAQPQREPVGSLLSPFHIGTADYERLLTHSRRAELTRKFRELERLRRRSEVQYELMTGPARRLLEAVCDSVVVWLRCRPGPFDWDQVLQERRLIAFDGGGIRSREIKRALFLLASMQVIHAVRRHFARTQQVLPVVLVLEEAGATDLVTPFILAALQELRKQGLAVHVITQSSLDFGDHALFQSLLANTPWQAWYQCLSPADQDLGAKALLNASFDPLAVHYTRSRTIRDGEEAIPTASAGESVSSESGAAWHERRKGIAFIGRYRAVDDPFYKSAVLQEQEYRTRLATLCVGERLVRDRTGVRRERVRMLLTPRLPGGFDAVTRSVIERIRRQAIYLPCHSTEPASDRGALRDAALRLQGEAA